MSDTIISEKLSCKERINRLDKQMHSLAKKNHNLHEAVIKMSRDVSHMYSIVKQLHKEHETIMKLNGHETLLTTIDKLME